MTASTSTQHTTPLADFTAATPFNLPIWRREVAQIVMLQQPLGINQVGSNVVAQWPNNTDPADIAAYQAQVPVHVGGVITAAPHRFSNLSETSQDTNTLQTRLAAVSGKLAAGSWAITFGAEIRMNAVVALTGVEFIMQFSKDSDPLVEQAEDTWGQITYHISSGGFPIAVLDGEQLNVSLLWRRIGASSNPAFIRRARIGMVRVGD